MHLLSEKNGCSVSVMRTCPMRVLACDESIVRACVNLKSLDISAVGTLKVSLSLVSLQVSPSTSNTVCATAFSGLAKRGPLGGGSKFGERCYTVRAPWAARLESRMRVQPPKDPESTYWPKQGMSIAIPFHWCAYTALITQSV